LKIEKEEEKEEEEERLIHPFPQQIAAMKPPLAIARRSASGYASSPSPDPSPRRSETWWRR
jgi:hypothetical protein